MDQIHQVTPRVESSTIRQISSIQLFLVFLKLGLIAFGGPVAHISYFRTEFVERRSWLSASYFQELLALCQFLPGPASSQLGMAIGFTQRRYWGSFLAFLGFTLPSAFLLVLLALGLSTFSSSLLLPLGAGLKIAAVGIVAHAVWTMSHQLCQGIWQYTILLVSCALAYTLSSSLTALAIILFAGLLGQLLPVKQENDLTDEAHQVPSHSTGKVLLLVFALGLCLFPLLSYAFPNPKLALIAAFYRCGALVFGGGHVVLPLLATETVEKGWLSSDTFMLGYGAMQSLPGPLFSFSAFLGAASLHESSPFLGACLGLLALFAPSYLLILGAWPFWNFLRRRVWARSALFAINPAVVGLLLAAFFDPVWTTGIHKPLDILFAAGVWVALQFGKAPSWLVVPVCSLLYFLCH